MALVTRQEVLDWMKMPAGSEADAIIDKLILSVSARCQQVARCTFEPVSNAKDITGDGTDTLILPVRPVIGVSVITIEDGDPLVEGWDEDYVLDGAVIKLVSQRWSRRPGGNHIEWASGYAEVPEDIRLSLWKAISFDLKAQDKRREGITSTQTIDGQNTNYTTKEYPDDVMDVWRSYQRMAIA